MRVQGDGQHRPPRDDRTGDAGPVRHRAQAQNVEIWTAIVLIETRPKSVQIGGYRAVRRWRTVTVCDETSAPGGHTGCPQAQVSVKQKRHGEHESVTVTIAEGFRSASYDLSIFIRSDVRHS
jgi:hypothetical protein